MENKELRKELMEELWEINSMDIIEELQNFLKGTTATLWCLQRMGGGRKSFCY